MANLKIAAITKQDTETQYILTAYNAMGTQDYTILISTSPEPEGTYNNLPPLPPVQRVYY